MISRIFLIKICKEFVITLGLGKLLFIIITHDSFPHQRNNPLPLIITDSENYLIIITVT